MAFIDTIDDQDIDAEVRAMYERQQGHYGYVPNYAKAFCHRPHVMKLWADLQNGIRREMDKRRFELVTFAAAQAVMVAFARTVAVDATAVTADDVRGLKEHGFSDGEIFDIAATSAARAFWTKLLDALGVEADAAFQKLDPEFRDALAVGRALDFDSRQGERAITLATVSA